MADNRVVVHKGRGEVAVEDIEYPKLEVPEEVAEAMGMTKEAPHAVILKIVSTNVCPADQYMVRGRTTAPVGQTLGHEITGEVIEKGNDVQERDARKEMVEIPQRDGTVKRFPKSALMEAFLYLIDVACGDSPTEEPEIFGALRNAREPAQKWMGTFYFDPAEMPAVEPVPDLSEPVNGEDPY